MKENTLDVLFYLFDNYPDMGDNLPEDRQSMHGYLQEAVFYIVRLPALSTG